MVKSFNHKGLQAFFERGPKAGIQPDHAPKPKIQSRTHESAGRACDGINKKAGRL